MLILNHLLKPVVQLSHLLTLQLCLNLVVCRAQVMEIFFKQNSNYYYFLKKEMQN